MLTYLNDPRGWYRDHNLPIQDFVAGSRRNALETALPEFAARKDFTDVLLGDLSSAGFLLAGVNGMVSGGAVYDALTTPLAKRFIAFITAPHPAH
jgi:hypothetical protein